MEMMSTIAVPSVDPAMIAARRAQQKRAQILSGIAPVEIPSVETPVETEMTTETTGKMRLRVLVTLQKTGTKYSTGVCGNGEKVFIDKKYVKHFSHETSHKCDIRETPGKKMSWKCIYVHP